MALTVLIANAYELMVEGLQRILGAEFSIVATATEPLRVLELVEVHRPDVAVVDLLFERPSGASLIRQIGASYPLTLIIATGLHDTPEQDRRARHAGAAEYLGNKALKAQLPAAIHAAAAKRGSQSPISGAGTHGQSLGKRQREILELIIRGKTAKEIGHHLCISARTVEWHKRKLMNDLELRTTAALIEFGLNLLGGSGGLELKSEGV